MNMKALTFNAAWLALLSAGLLPAADPQLLNLVMPDAKVLAGINVDQAKNSAFGQYVLTQIQTQGAQHLQQVTALTGFDPTRDVHELLIASNGAPGSQTGLILANGNFDAGKIRAAAVSGGGATVDYNTVTLILDPKQTHAVAFLSSTLAVAGDVASVKGAIDRQTASAAPITATVATQVNQWSTTEDAWVIAAVPLSSLQPPTNSSNPQGAVIQNAFQSVQQAAGGVKFNDPILFTGELDADTAQNATAMRDILQFLAGLAQMQAQQKDPQAGALPLPTVTATGTAINLSLSIPESQAEQFVKLQAPALAPQTIRRPQRRRL